MKRRGATLDEVMATDPHLNFDAGVSVRIVGNVKLNLNGRNLGGQRVVASHRPYGARPNAPRWIQGGMKAEF